MAQATESRFVMPSTMKRQRSCLNKRVCRSELALAERITQKRNRRTLKTNINTQTSDATLFVMAA